MRELIDRDEAIFATWQDTSYTNPWNVLTEVRYRIKALPTIDAVPVVHGEWKEWDDGDNTWSCSVCGNPFVLIDGTPSDNEMNYCPNCGARMDGERSEA